MDSTAQNLTPQTGTPQQTDPATGQVPADPVPAGGTSPGGKLAAYRMRRSTTDRMLAGVCGGLAADLGVDAALLRIAVLVLTLVSGGAFALVYLAAWLVAPAR